MRQEGPHSSNLMTTGGAQQDISAILRIGYRPHGSGAHNSSGRGMQPHPDKDVGAIPLRGRQTGASCWINRD
jgi:hypothetical protein